MEHSENDTGCSGKIVFFLTIHCKSLTKCSKGRMGGKDRYPFPSLSVRLCLHMSTYLDLGSKFPSFRLMFQQRRLPALGDTPTFTYIHWTHFSVSQGFHKQDQKFREIVRFFYLLFAFFGGTISAKTANKCPTCEYKLVKKNGLFIVRENPILVRAQKLASPLRSNSWHLHLVQSLILLQIHLC